MCRIYILLFYLTCVLSVEVPWRKKYEETIRREFGGHNSSSQDPNKCIYISTCGYPGLKAKNGHEVHRKIDIKTGLPHGYGVIGVPERKTWKHIFILQSLLMKEVLVFNAKVKKTFYIGRHLMKVNGLIKCMCAKNDRLGETIWIQNIRPSDPKSGNNEIAAVDVSTGRVYHLVTPVQEKAAPAG